MEKSVIGMTPTEQIRHWISIVEYTSGDSGNSAKFHIVVSFWAKVIAAITTFAIILGGIGGFVNGVVVGFNFGKNLGWW